MKKNRFIKINEAISLLKEGWEIFTERGNSYPGGYNPLYFHLYKNGEDRKELHRQTIEKLIRDGIITGTETKHGKYSYIEQN